MSSMRIVGSSPNTVLGLIPLGSDDFQVPLNNVANVGVNSRWSIFRALFGIIFMVAGLQIGDAGLILALLGLSMLLNSASAALTIDNNGGGRSTVTVSFLEKKKLEKFRETVNQRLFNDHQLGRHEDVMKIQHSQLMMQTMQLEAQLRAAPQSGSYVPAGLSHQSPQANPSNQVFQGADAETSPPVPSAQSGMWAKDPAERYEMRYFDGSKWTHHVSTNGSTSIDPL
ncbi:DUF2510 domain-containing protein [Nakamurella antarctica]|uniref:DUF2510 domain-containing protein n=1 Tax=Nakamurella antarctica TaxID=1902245 RepID=UPI0013DDC23C